MSEKEGRLTLSFIREFSKTPRRSLGTPRRVPVDSNGNEIAKTPRKIPRTPLSKSSQPRGFNSACVTPFRTPCQIQVSPSQSRSHLISSKLNEHSQFSRASTPTDLKSLEKEEKSNVLLNSEMVIEKENILVIKDEVTGKESTPLKGKICLEGHTSARKQSILSLLSRFKKRENFIRSPALRVEVKDSMEGCGKKRKASVPKSDIVSSNQFQQCKRSDHVRKKLDVSKSSTQPLIKKLKSDVLKSSTQSHINQLQQSSEK